MPSTLLTTRLALSASEASPIGLRSHREVIHDAGAKEANGLRMLVSWVIPSSDVIDDYKNATQMSCVIIRIRSSHILSMRFPEVHPVCKGLQRLRMAHTISSGKFTCVPWKVSFFDGYPVWVPLVCLPAVRSTSNPARCYGHSKSYYIFAFISGLVESLVGTWATIGSPPVKYHVRRPRTALPHSPLHPLWGWMCSSLHD